MSHIGREWRKRWVGWRIAAIAIVAKTFLWLIDKAAELIFERAMKPEWLYAALYWLSAAATDRLVVGATAMAAFIVVFPYLVGFYKICMKVAGRSRDLRHPIMLHNFMQQKKTLRLPIRKLN
ncbi:MAG: hypothetical protein JNM75_08120 [Rhodospirillales bacterium]|nr:hypothetical protein [Rhodospirillales bacterium]